MQKKTRLAPLLLPLLLVLSFTVHAVEIMPLWASTTRCDPPTLSFSGTTVTCKSSVYGTSGAKIDGTLTLYQGTTEVDSWTLSGTTRANVSGSCAVTRGKSYRLVLDVTVDGSDGADHIVKETTATCP